MKIQQVNQNQKSPSFCAIGVPKSASNVIYYRIMMEAVDTFAPKEGIKVKSGLTKNGDAVEYIMTKAGSESENKIFDMLFAISDKIDKFKAHDIRANIARHEKRYHVPAGNEESFGIDGATSAQERIKLKADTYNIKNNQWLFLSDNQNEVELIANLKTPQGKYDLKQFFKIIQNQPSVEDPQMEAIRTTFHVFKMQKIQKDGYIGGMLNSPSRKPKDVTATLAAFKKAGINTIIDFTYEDKNYRNACLDAGLKYYRTDVGNACTADGKFAEEKMAFLSLENFTKHMPTNTSLKKIEEIYHKNSKIFTEDFINLIELFQKGNFFGGCVDVMIRTRKILELNSIFNPKAEKNIIHTHQALFSNEELQNLYKNLTTADKKRIGYTPEFEAQLKKRLDIA